MSYVAGWLSYLAALLLWNSVHSSVASACSSDFVGAASEKFETEAESAALQAFVVGEVALVEQETCGAYLN